MSKCDECKQQIYDRAEALADAIQTAAGCTGALIYLRDQLGDDLTPIADQAGCVVTAAEHFLARAREQADQIARLTMDPR